MAISSVFDPEFLFPAVFPVFSVPRVLSDGPLLNYVAKVSTYAIVLVTHSTFTLYIHGHTHWSKRKHICPKPPRKDPETPLLGLVKATCPAWANHRGLEWNAWIWLKFEDVLLHLDDKVKLAALKPWGPSSLLPQKNLKLLRRGKEANAENITWKVHFGKFTSFDKNSFLF